MQKSLSRDMLRQWARHGAAIRLRELEAERAAILREFPDLRTGRRGPGKGQASGVAKATGGRRRRRRKLTPEGRAAISRAAKARWARQRAGATKKAKGKSKKAAAGKPTTTA